MNKRMIVILGATDICINLLEGCIQHLKEVDTKKDVIYTIDMDLRELKRNVNRLNRKLNTVVKHIKRLKQGE